jgi:5-methylcytosine-specific restriction protein A
MSKRPICEGFCAKENRVTVASELHHIVPLRRGGARLDEDNVMPICGPCHRRITAQESR